MLNLDTNEPVISNITNNPNINKLNEYKEKLENINQKVSGLQIRLHEIEKVLKSGDIDATENVEGIKREYVALLNEFNELYEFDDINDKIKESTQIGNVLNKFYEERQLLIDKKKKEISDIWDEEQQKPRQETRWKYNIFSKIFSNKPTEDEIKEKVDLINKEIDKLNFTTDIIDEDSVKKIGAVVQVSMQKTLDELARIQTLCEQNIVNKRKKDEQQEQAMQKKRQENEKKQQILSNSKSNNNRGKANKKNKSINIPEEDVEKSIKWLKNNGGNKDVTKDKVIKWFNKLSVNNFEDFRVAVLKRYKNEKIEKEIRKIQEFVKQDKNKNISREQCIRWMKEWNFKSLGELKDMLNHDAQEIAETINPEKADEIKLKLNQDNASINDYVNTMNKLIDDEDTKLIKPTTIQELQMNFDRIKQEKENQNLFIKFLMFFGYDPDGLLTAYHIAKNRLKEAKRQFRRGDNALSQTLNSRQIIDNGLSNQMYAGNNNTYLNNKQSLYGQQSLQQINNNFLGK